MHGLFIKVKIGPLFTWFDIGFEIGLGTFNTNIFLQVTKLYYNTVTITMMFRKSDYIKEKKCQIVRTQWHALSFCREWWFIGL